jgi:hypothetical protein
MDRDVMVRTAALVVMSLIWGVGYAPGAQDPQGDPSAGAAAAAPAAENVLDVDIGFFYDRLAPYGDWREHPTWGWVWLPRDVAVAWRPYTLGRWVYTDDFGWLWDSDLDWGWACFHYGRWGWEDDLGWFWVPGSSWGPAWVAWRTGPNLESPAQSAALGGPFIGWCPLPPRVRWEVGVGLVLGGVDLDDIPARRWVFVPTRFFDAPKLRDHLVLVSRNATLFRDTRNVTRFESVGGRAVDNSISRRRIEEATHRPVERFHVRHVDSPAAAHLPREHDGEISVFTPRIRRGPAGLAPPRSGELERRQRAARARLHEQQRAEESRQQERFRAERAAPSIGKQQLQRRQEAERRALQSEHRLQQRLLEGRQQRERGEFQRPERRSERRERGELGTPGATGRAREPFPRPEAVPQQRGREPPRQVRDP